MILVNTHEAKSQLSKFIAKVEKDRERIRLCRNGVPVADLVPINSRIIDPLKQHKELRGVHFYEDPMLPLAEGDWPSEYRI